MLITGDVASEGVNLHAQCHELIHFDIPWSLIRIEQRNGRIDRYGQQHPPRIAALALTTTDEKFSGDVRVLTRLMAKEHEAHTALGDAASLIRQHDVGREEDEIRARWPRARRWTRWCLTRRPSTNETPTRTSRRCSPASARMSLRHLRSWTAEACLTARWISCVKPCMRRSRTPLSCSLLVGGNVGFVGTTRGRINC